MKITESNGVPLRVLVSGSQDPWFNLATEDWIFRQMPPQQQTLFLWQNGPTVVIGRNQNPWSECKLSQMEEDGVLLARRTSGGGAVFHDLGNMCFTFLSPREAYDRKANLSVVLGALERFGVKAEASGRNDLIVEREDGPRKISGSAFRETRDRAFHHGTLLLNSNLERLGDYLTPHPKKLDCKGRPSVRSRVMNLSEIAPEIEFASVNRALIQEFFAYYGAECEVEILDPQRTARAPGLREFYEKLASWEWRYGHSPAFKQQMHEKFDWGFVEVHVDAEGGRIEGLKIFSDALVPDLIEAFEANLRGRTFTGVGVSEAAAETRAFFPELTLEVDELAQWLKTQVEI